MRPRDRVSLRQESKWMSHDLAPRDLALTMQQARDAQPAWAAVGIVERLRVLKRFRHSLAQSAEEIAATIPAELPGNLHRTPADSLVSEVLPLAEACRFLEREAAAILAPKIPGNRERPFWLRSVKTTIHREPFGTVLIVGPGNYPLLLPGAQALQALAAGNAVLWKPAPGGTAVASACRYLLVGAGLSPSLLHILEQAPASATEAIRAGVDKVFLTGSEATGKAVLRELAETLTPSVMELSGCDAVFILPGADLKRAVAALAFGLRLNGSATCMAPRRVFVTEAVAQAFIDELAEALDSIPAVTVPIATQEKLLDLMADAEAKGAHFRRNGLTATANYDAGTVAIQPTLIVQATAEMRITQADIFAPVLSILQVADQEAALAANARCPYALTASIFGTPKAAQRMAARVPAGSVLINDIIVATADPRAPFGGRRRSGFGATRGREGLLEMTTIKTIQVQHAKDLRAYTPPSEHHAGFIAGYIQAVHGGKRRDRLSGLRRFLKAMTKLK